MLGGRDGSTFVILNEVFFRVLVAAAAAALEEEDDDPVTAAEAANAAGVPGGQVTKGEVIDVG